MRKIRIIMPHHCQLGWPNEKRREEGPTFHYAVGMSCAPSKPMLRRPRLRHRHRLRFRLRFR